MYNSVAKIEEVMDQVFRTSKNSKVTSPGNLTIYVSLRVIFTGYWQDSSVTPILRQCQVRHFPETADSISHGSITILISTWANMQGPKLRPPAR